MKQYYFRNIWGEIRFKPEFAIRHLLDRLIIGLCNKLMILHFRVNTLSVGANWSREGMEKKRDIKPRSNASGCRV